MQESHARVRLEAALEILDNLKAHNVRIFNVGRESTLADYYVVASGDAGKHIDAMAEELRMKFKTDGRHSIEGDGASGWVLIDIGDIIIHLFTDERREYYRLDELWKQSETGIP